MGKVGSWIPDRDRHKLSKRIRVVTFHYHTLEITGPQRLPENGSPVSHHVLHGTKPPQLIGHEHRSALQPCVGHVDVSICEEKKTKTNKTPSIIFVFVYIYTQCTFHFSKFSLILNWYRVTQRYLVSLSSHKDCHKLRSSCEQQVRSLHRSCLIVIF